MLTQPQFNIIRSILKGNKYGSDIRRDIKTYVRRTSFYLMTGRLVNLGYVTREFTKINNITHTIYTVTPLGLREFDQTKEYYNQKD